MKQSACTLTGSLFNLVVLACLFLSPLGLVAAPRPAVLPGDAAFGAAAGAQQSPAIARGGEILLAVWDDKRAQPTGDTFFEVETAGDIYGMRLDASGQPIDTVPFVITQKRGRQSEPKLAWNGTHWLVVFHSIDGVLEGVRVAHDGSIVDEKPLTIYGARPTNSGTWAVGSDGNNWVLGFQSTSPGGSVELVRITAAGVVELPATRVAPPPQHSRSRMRLEHASGVYMLTWYEFVDTLVTRFDADLNLLDPAPFSLLGAPLDGMAAGNGQFYITWTAGTALLGSRVDTSGALLDGAGVNISGSNPPQGAGAIAVVRDDSQWRASWSSSDTLHTARIDDNGQVLDPDGIAAPGAVSGVTAPTSGGGLEVAWTVGSFDDTDVRAAHIDAAGSAGPALELSGGAPMQHRSDVAAGDNGYMLVYRSDTSGQRRILVQPLDAAGNALTTEPVVLDTGTPTSGPGTPSVAWNGSVYLATWGNASGIVAQRLQQDGSPVDASPFPVMDGFGATEVAALGDTFLVMGRRFGSTTQAILPIAARVRGSDGMVLDPAGLVLGGLYVQSVAVTTIGDRWLAVWHKTFTHDDNLGDTKAAFVDANGVATPEFLVYGPYSIGGGNFIFSITAAGNDSAALVVQSAEQTSGVETDLAAVMVNDDGSVTPARNITPWPGNQYRPEAAWDGNQFVLVFNEQKNRFAEFTLDRNDARSDLYGMRLDAAGVPVDPQGFAFSLSPTAEAYPSVAAVNGVSLIAGSIMTNEAPFAAYRIGVSLFGDGANQWPVAVASASTGGGDIPLGVDFDSTGSFDPDGVITAFDWDFGDGIVSSLPAPSHTYLSPGEYVATLTVSDDTGVQTTDSVAVDVKAPNIDPVAVATASPTSGPAPLSVTLFGEESYDVDGSLGNFEWSFSDGGIYFGVTAFHTFSTPGAHTATLTVFDNRGGSGSTTIGIDVGEPNQQPVAVATATPTEGLSPLTVNFSSAGSNDPDGSIVAWEWDFGDGNGADAADPVHVYTVAGIYTATLTVTDNRGGSASDSVQITVSEEICSVNCLRSARIDFGSRNIGSFVRIIGSVLVNDENGVPVPNANVSITWTRPNGGEVTGIFVTGSNGRIVSSIIGRHGTYSLAVTSIERLGQRFDPDNSVLSASITR